MTKNQRFLACPSRHSQKNKGDLKMDRRSLFWTRNNKKGFLQLSFPWLFAMIVGAVILFLAIYGVTRLVTTEETIQSAKASKELGVLLNPLETGFEEAKTSSLSFPVETRISNKCNSLGEFGRQLFQLSQMSRGEWVETDIDAGFSNKYIFSRSIVEGKNMLIFSKPFNFPFKVADVIYITTAEDIYCFIDSPDNIEQELDDLGQENLLIEDCEDRDDVVKVCFSGTQDCNIEVNYDSGYVEKRGEKLYFKTDALMYGAIFSDKEVYECQVKRLMKRVASLIALYRDKAELIECGMDPEFLSLINRANSFASSSELNSIYSIVEAIESRNARNSLCRLW